MTNDNTDNITENDDDSKDGFVERRKEVIERRVGMDRRRGPGIRRSPERKSAEEGEMNDEQFEFLLKIRSLSRHGQKFLT